MPLISAEARKCVAFVGTRNKSRFIPMATAFFAAYFEDQHQFNHLVTAEHVVSGMITRGQKIWLRVNLDNGDVAEIPVDETEFRFHPNAERDPTDVAVCPTVTNVIDYESDGRAAMDVRLLALNGDKSIVAGDDWIEERVGPGTVVSMIGLFRSHYGAERNIPVVRIGNIAAMPEEPVRTNYCGYIKAYLIEAMSIAGLSGSPVFAHVNTSNILLDRIATKKMPQPLGLLGLVHGHFDVDNLNEDVVTDHIGDVSRGIHSGIGVVVPVQKIIETVEHPELIAMRKAETAKRKSE